MVVDGAAGDEEPSAISALRRPAATSASTSISRPVRLPALRGRAPRSARDVRPPSRRRRCATTGPQRGAERVELRERRAQGLLRPDVRPGERRVVGPLESVQASAARDVARELEPVRPRVAASGASSMPARRRQSWSSTTTPVAPVRVAMSRALSARRGAACRREARPPPRPRRRPGTSCVAHQGSASRRASSIRGAMSGSPRRARTRASIASDSVVGTSRRRGVRALCGRSSSRPSSGPRSARRGSARRRGTARSARRRGIAVLEPASISPSVRNDSAAIASSPFCSATTRARSSVSVPRTGPRRTRTGRGRRARAPARRDRPYARRAPGHVSPTPSAPTPSDRGMGEKGHRRVGVDELRPGGRDSSTSIASFATGRASAPRPGHQRIVARRVSVSPCCRDRPARNRGRRPPGERRSHRRPDRSDSTPPPGA